MSGQLVTCWLLASQCTAGGARLGSRAFSPTLNHSQDWLIAAQIQQQRPIDIHPIIFSNC